MICFRKPQEDFLFVTAYRLYSHFPQHNSASLGHDHLYNYSVVSWNCLPRPRNWHLTWSPMPLKEKEKAFYVNGINSCCYQAAQGNMVHNNCYDVVAVFCANRNRHFRDIYFSSQSFRRIIISSQLHSNTDTHTQKQKCHLLGGWQLAINYNYWIPVKTDVDIKPGRACFSLVILSRVWTCLHCLFIFLLAFPK